MKSFRHAWHMDITNLRSPIIPISINQQAEEEEEKNNCNSLLNLELNLIKS